MPNTTAEAVEGLTRSVLAARYDNPKPIPAFHRQLWADCCSDDKWVADACPREHGKSTSVTHAFVLARLLFQDNDFVLIVSDTEGQAAEFLGDIKLELQDNESLRQLFPVKKFRRETETDIVVEMEDGHIFRVLAKGSMQKVRGLKWRGKRPNLIIGDDLENDEIVQSPERRLKFRRWFMNALLPCGSDDCIVRIVGTILHLDSLLNRLMDNPEWRSQLFAAHNKDFSEILWPEKFPEERLRKLRRSFAADGNLEGYSQEYLNNPIAEGATYFRKQDFIPMDGDKGVGPDYESPKVYFAAADFAISEKERADYTVIMVGGMDPDGFLHIVDVRRDRWDADDIINELITVEKRWHPEIFTFETEKIDKALGPSLERAQRREHTYININRVTPSASKTTRGKSIQKMMKSGSCRFDAHADWYPDLYDELMTISNEGPKGKHDDHFDAFAYIGLTVNQYWEADTAHQTSEYEYEREVEEFMDMGVDEVTGY